MTSMLIKTCHSWTFIVSSVFLGFFCFILSIFVSLYMAVLDLSVFKASRALTPHLCYIWCDSSRKVKMKNAKTKSIKTFKRFCSVWAGRKMQFDNGFCYIYLSNSVILCCSLGTQTCALFGQQNRSKNLITQTGVKISVLF